MDRGGPDGGDGGRGGSVFVQVFPHLLQQQNAASQSPSQNQNFSAQSQKNLQNQQQQNYQFSNANNLNFKSLNHIVFHQRAESGLNGMSKKRKGRNGQDLIIYVPPGTIVRDVDSGSVLADVSGVERDSHGEAKKFLIARGGVGGMGNIHFASGANRSPREFTLGKTGEQRIVEMELKAIADVGLVGYPNAGKSSLLSTVSAVTPKIAAYPFTTLHPTVGEVITQNFSTFTMADIPGLIEGAHANVGLGHDFLRHIERTKMLVYVLDVSGLEGMGMQRDDESGKLTYSFPERTDVDQVALEEKTPLHLIEMTHREKKMKRIMDSERIKEMKADDENFMMDYGIELDDETNESDEKNTRSVKAKKPMKTPKLRQQVKEQAMAIKRVKDIEVQKLNQRKQLDFQDRERKKTLQELEMENIELEDEDEKEQRIEEIRQEIRKNKNNMYILQPWEVLKKLERELELYMPGLSSNAKLIVANKMDVPGAAKNLEILRQHTNLPIFPVSALKNENIQPVIEYCHKVLGTIHTMNKTTADVDAVENNSNVDDNVQ